MGYEVWVHWVTMMKAAIYARYSSDLQRAASIEDQVRLCRKRIARERWQLIATYTDRASSGADRLRPGYQKLMEDARAGAFMWSSPRRSTVFRATRRTWPRSTSACALPASPS